MSLSFVFILVFTRSFLGLLLPFFFCTRDDTLLPQNFVSALVLKDF